VVIASSRATDETFGSLVEKQLRIRGHDLGVGQGNGRTTRCATRD
jgi:hypothetical protein